MLQSTGFLRRSARILCLFLPLVTLFAATGCTASQAAPQERDEAPLIYREVYGKVVTAFGNEITLAEGTLQAAEGPPEGGGPDGQADGSPVEAPAETENSGGGRPSGPDGSTGEFPGGEMPGGGQRGGRSGGMAANAGSSTLALDYTGEETTYQIPVTATITNGQGENAQTVRFTQLAAKNVVKISFDENGTILSVQILG